jgi:hypothetical protein
VKLVRLTKVTATSSSRETASIHARGAPSTLIAASIFPLGEKSFKLGRATEPATEAEVVGEAALLPWVAGSELSVPVPVSDAASVSDSRSLPVLNERPRFSSGGGSAVFIFHEPVISARSRFIVRKFDAGAEKGEVGLTPGDRGGGSGALRDELRGDSGAYGGGASGWGT